MGRRNRSPSPPPPPPMGHQPTYHFENYEDGKPRWAPGTDNQRDYRDYRDSRRGDHRRSKKRDAYDDAPPPRPPPPPGYGEPPPPPPPGYGEQPPPPPQDTLRNRLPLLLECSRRLLHQDMIHAPTVPADTAPTRHPPNPTTHPLPAAQVAARNPAATAGANTTHTTHTTSTTHLADATTTGAATATATRATTATTDLRATMAAISATAPAMTTAIAATDPAMSVTTTCSTRDETRGATHGMMTAGGVIATMTAGAGVAR
ncbi:hypothetical protein JI435_005750 [Parastagonospora nodorum SN15]|uniref:Uncharacterized protein n=1 Tax=Phaeosphaeria nodorum (strain SN15 / ATCC MYA-4574 / FGSC 10173) TaxID=321614 RepID=A0A7U2ER35_PHANO|nr:hypothetical protein JI435_005750 [Parastagonospora nodorum SN15]